ncbi:hypothetical protein HS1genome_0719 [Sulfodiicoccus acidiphilus]|uniref:Flagellin n=1 Tax=Sulfodiicoccus acidiphilus TaxID=1670455 RepID=A0A348B2C8_9CREN|nr:hypothetical protein [Sulfodiicoccus acidiphilus]BBD72330.1 hypothetical protein HS1genome_0719 [Sulfodiicoccus acidiphilus]
MKGQSGIIGGAILILIMMGAVGLISAYQGQVQRDAIQGSNAVRATLNEPILYIQHNGGTEVYSSGRDEIAYVIYPNGTERGVQINVGPAPVNVSYLVPSGWALFVTSDGLIYNVSSYASFYYGSSGETFTPLVWPEIPWASVDSNNSIRVTLELSGGEYGLHTLYYTYSIVLAYSYPLQQVKISTGDKSLTVTVPPGSSETVYIYLPMPLLFEGVSMAGGFVVLDLTVVYGGPPILFLCLFL